MQVTAWILVDLLQSESKGKQEHLVGLHAKGVTFYNLTLIITFSYSSMLTSTGRNISKVNSFNYSRLYLLCVANIIPR